MQSLGEHFEFIAKEAPEVVRTLALLIDKAATQIAAFPLVGRPGRVVGTRELIIARTPFILVYRIKGAAVEVLRVLHSAQKWP